MRISTNQVFTQGLNSILDQQSTVLKTQDQVASAKKYRVPSDNPSAASRILDLNESIAQLEQFDRNADFATQRLNLEEVTLESSINVIQRVKELSVQAANTGVQNLQSRQAIAAELKEKLSELMDYANTKDVSGDYLFAGFQSKTQPFTRDVLGNITYNGDEGQLQLQIGSSRQVTSSDSGAEVFQRIRMGNGDFSVDAHTANSGTGVISVGSVVNPAAFQQQDFRIQFTAPDTYDVINATTGATVATAQPFTDGDSINFNGLQVEITGTPDAGDSFSVNASRNQDVFTSLQKLIDTLDTPSTGNIRGSFGGDYINNGFDVGDTINFNVDFDGVSIPVSYTVAAGDTNANIAAGIVADINADANVTDNGDGTYTLQGTTAGLSLTFQLNGDNIAFQSDGGNVDRSSNLSINSFTDDDTSGAANPAFMDIISAGNTAISTAVVDSSSDAVYAPGALTDSVLSQQIANAMQNFDQAMNRMIDVQARIGGRLNAIESQRLDNESRDVQLKGVKSDIEDLDMAEAISRLTFQTTALQVAQQTFVRIQNLNLFSLL